MIRFSRSGKAKVNGRLAASPPPPCMQKLGCLGASSHFLADEGLDQKDGSLCINYYSNSDRTALSTLAAQDFTCPFLGCCIHIEYSPAFFGEICISSTQAISSDIKFPIHFPINQEAWRFLGFPGNWLFFSASAKLIIVIHISKNWFKKCGKYPKFILIHPRRQPNWLSMIGSCWIIPFLGASRGYTVPQLYSQDLATKLLQRYWSQASHCPPWQVQLKRHHQDTTWLKSWEFSEANGYS